jgi:hypothetical protein
MDHARPFWTSTLQDLSNGIKNTSMRGVLTPTIAFWIFGSPGGLPSPTFGSVSGDLTFPSKWGCDIVVANFVMVEKGFDCHPMSWLNHWMAIETHFRLPYIRHLKLSHCQLKPFLVAIQWWCLVGWQLKPFLVVHDSNFLSLVSAIFYHWKLNFLSPLDIKNSSHQKLSKKILHGTFQNLVVDDQEGFQLPSNYLAQFSQICIHI